MSRLLLTFLFALPFAACSSDAAADSSGGAETAAGEGASASESGWPAGYDDSDCNLQTVLDPDKPGSPGNLITSERNPNGDSELAVLMRRFVEDLRDNRLLAEAGEPTKPMFPTHRAMRCAWPTVPADRDETYDQRAITYLTAVRNFDEAPSKDGYNAIVNTCVACHQVTCGGVIDFIEGLRWQ